MDVKHETEKNIKDFNNSIKNFNKYQNNLAIEKAKNDEKFRQELMVIRFKYFDKPQLYQPNYYHPLFKPYLEKELDEDFILNLYIRSYNYNKEDPFARAALLEL